MASELKPCPFCRKPMMLRSALWPSEGDADAIIHAEQTDCPMLGFGDGSANGSIVEKWNSCSSDDEDDFPSDGSCIRCGSVPRNANGLCNTCLDEDAECLENTRPAAPVGGLETVGYQIKPKPTDQWVKDWFPSDPAPTDGAKRELVTRSQAEAIIAAKDAEIKQLKADLQSHIDGTTALVDEKIDAEFKAVALQADNAALTARVKELEADVAKREEHRGKLMKGYRGLETQLAATKKALTEIDNLDQAMGHELKLDDAFEAVRIARAALEAKP